MGVPEKARGEIYNQVGSNYAKAMTVQGRYTTDGRARIFLNGSAFADGFSGLVSALAHEFIHVAGVNGVDPPWYKPWQDDLSFDPKYQRMIDTCTKAGLSYFDAK